MVVTGGLTLSQVASPVQEKRKETTPRAVINLKDLKPSLEVKRQLQFLSSEKKRQSFEVESTIDSKVLESPPPLPVRNDYLKYFNHFSKEGEDFVQPS